MPSRSERQWVWGGVRIRTARGATVVSGLERREAATLAARAEQARIAWWRGLLAEHADALCTIDSRLADLDAPRCYLRHRAFSSLVQEVETGSFVVARVLAGAARRGTGRQVGQAHPARF